MGGDEAVGRFEVLWTRRGGDGCWYILMHN